MALGKTQGTESVSLSECKESVNYKLVGGDKLDTAIHWFGVAVGIRHDINNALTSVISTVGFLAEDADDEEVVKDLRTIRHGGEQIDAIMKRIGLLRDSHVEVTLNDLNLFAVSRFGGQAEVVNAESVGEVPFDLGKLEVVVNELIKNAKESVEDVEGGQVVLRIGKRDVEAENYFFVEVSDNGSGVEESKHEEIFLPSIGRQCRGIGLSIVYYMVSKLMNGKVLFSSKTGQDSYTKVTVLLPDKVDGDMRSLETELEEVDTDVSGMNIVVVDDMLNIRKIVCSIVRSENGNISGSFECGETLIENLDSVPSGSVIVLDNDMLSTGGKMSGVAVAADIKSKRPDLKILLYTADFADCLNVTGLLAEGIIDKYLAKPSDPDTLLAAICKIGKTA